MRAQDVRYSSTVQGCINIYRKRGNILCTDRVIVFSSSSYNLDVLFVLTVILINFVKNKCHLRNCNISVVDFICQQPFYIQSNKIFLLRRKSCDGSLSP